MAFKKTFIVSTEDVNTYGFWVSTSGIDLSNAQNNCPAFYNHNTWEIPLGHWDNIRISGTKLLADIVIEGATEREKEYIRKIENGDIKGASIGLDPLTWDNTATHIKTGQSKETLLKSSLFEISLTPLPGNQSALALKHNGSLIKLTADNAHNLIPQLQKKVINMEAIALKLGLNKTATENEIITEIGNLQQSHSSNQELANSLISEAEEGLEKEAKEFFKTLCKADVMQAIKYAKSTKDTSNIVLKKDVTISSLIKKGIADEGASNEKNCFDYLQKNNPLELKKIHQEDPEKYAQLAKEYANGVRYKN